MYLTITALKEFWNHEDDRVYLGAWCLFPDHIDLWYKEKSKILESPWTCPVYYQTQREYCERFSSSLLSKLQVVFNDYFQKENSNRYWNILFGQWLTIYISRYLNRYECVKKAINELTQIDTILLDLDTDIHEVKAKYKQDLDEFKKFSNIFIKLGYSFVQKSIPIEWQTDKVSEVWSTEKKRERLVNHDSVIISGWMMYDRNIIQEILSNAGLKNDILGYYDLDSLLPDFKKDNLHPLRNIIRDLEVENEFEKIVIEEIGNEFPPCFIEGYKFLDEIAHENLTLKQSYILSAIGCQENTLFKFIAASLSEQGAKIVLTQHGAVHGTYEYLPSKKFEFEIADLYLTWGWFTSESNKIWNISSLASDNIATPSSGASKVLYLSNQFTKYFVDFRSAIKCFGSDLYFDKVVAFFNFLPEEIRKNVLFRSKSELPSCVSDYLKGKFNSLEFDNRTTPLKDRFATSKLVICDCFTHVYIDALKTMPTILFWDEKIWRANAEAQLFLDELKHVGVLFDNPLLAAKKVEEVWEDPQTWWSDEALQSAVQNFIRKFSRTSIDFKEEWADKLKRIVSKNHD